MQIGLAPETQLSFSSGPSSTLLLRAIFFSFLSILIGFALAAVDRSQEASASKSVGQQRSGGQYNSPPSAVSPLDGFAYFFDLAGDFEKIAVRTAKEEAHGQVPAAAKIVGPHPHSGIDGCVFCQVRYDRNSDRLYVVLAKQASLTQDSEGAYEIVALVLPQMQTAARASVGVAEPVVIVSAKGKKLLASYQLDSEKSDELAFGLSIYGIPALELLRTVQETTTRTAYLAGHLVNAKFSDQAYFGSDGETIYDQFSKSELIDDKVTKVQIDPATLLVKSANKSLQPFALVDIRTNAPTFDATYVDSRAGTLLIALNAGRNVPQALVVIDMDKPSVSALIRVPQVIVPAVHLTPDGKEVVMEGAEVRRRPGAKPDEPQEATFKTGTLVIFNATTGDKVREISAPAISSFDSRLLCISPDGGLAFFAHDGHLFDVNLAAGTVAKQGTDPSFTFDQWTQCVFAGR